MLRDEYCRGLDGCVRRVVFFVGGVVNDESMRVRGEGGGGGGGGGGVEQRYKRGRQDC